ncbi:hypothetical protein GVN21_17200 [Caulobacter sp. SLTY]|uniref:hypothetical protein n=1 Tax=Caulobacter sp. SLTY TaxID=2683262 RepID=UPI0014123B6A|nr:hypothetical protein [Caulobacter sp. SLTY]NBB17105.1 hypothetical protein [Caulobacter sp. SLTY]
MASGDYVSIVTPDDTSYDGFVIALSDAFVLLQNIESWRVDGVRVFPLGQIAEIRHDDVRKGQQAVLEWRGVDRGDRYEWLDLGDFQALFESVRARGVTVVVHDEEVCDLGVVIAATAAAVELRPIDTGGNWEDEPWSVSYDDIWHVGIGDDYSAVLRAYADRTPA